MGHSNTCNLTTHSLLVNLRIIIMGLNPCHICPDPSCTRLWCIPPTHSRSHLKTLPSQRRQHKGLTLLYHDISIESAFYMIRILVWMGCDTSYTITAR